MGKVFTITEGLENMGALKTGGQGSVYKGRRIGEIITAVKLLPTPIHTESADDKNFIDFQNEVAKLKKVNENPNPHVVKILSSGITETGSFPFIEMEFIEGPDLEELLKPPHDPVFTIKETIKVADQLSQALAHCHKVDVRHGDIKSNNVKFSTDTGNYVLLDFGLAIMSDEQRRTSLRHAGAIEFMAPEQNDGVMLFQTDVYSLGVILFELLAGTVPFPLTDKGETARNIVRLSHIETPPPDVLAFRRDNLPDTWSDEKKDREMNVPDWLLRMIYKCLEKNAQSRFSNGIELHDYIILNSTLSGNKVEVAGNTVNALKEENEKLALEKGKLQTAVLEQNERLSKTEEELTLLKDIVTHKDAELNALKDQSQTTYTYDDVPVQSGVSKSAFYALLAVTACLAAFTIYTLFFSNRTNSSGNVVSGVDTSLFVDSSGPTSEASTTDELEDEPAEIQERAKAAIDSAKRVAAKRAGTPNEPGTNPAGTSSGNAQEEQGTETPNQGSDNNTENTDQQDNGGKARYTVVSKAYFHNEPDESTRREAFIVHWNNAKLTPLEEQNGFVYVVFTNHLGQVSKGWLRKKDLKAMD